MKELRRSSKILNKAFQTIYLLALNLNRLARSPATLYHSTRSTNKSVTTLLSVRSAILLLTILGIFIKPIKPENFLQCMTTRHLSTVVYTRESTLYFPLFQKSQQNPRWLNTSSAFKPLYIVTPLQEVEISATVICSRENGLRVRVRSGGHDYEGLSYLSRTPFVLIDLVPLRDIEINMEDKTAWVQSGATLGELYYNIARKSNTYGYPAGMCPTVGVGGHISGGGIGALTRKYGLAADYVVNAHLVDVNGRVLDRNSMGEEVFWAIRGGGGASFGVITAWKIRLVPVPRTITVLTVHKSLEQGANKLIDKWQRIAHKLPEDLFIRIIVQIKGGGGYGVKKTVQASFNSMFLGNIQR